MQHWLNLIGAGIISVTIALMCVCRKALILHVGELPKYLCTLESG